MKRIVSHDTARLAKEVGYHPELILDEVNQWYFTDGSLTKYEEERYHHKEAVSKNKVLSVVAPTIFDLHEWLCEHESIWVCVHPIFTVNELIDIRVTLLSWRIPPVEAVYDGFDVFEAWEVGIVKAMKFLKK